MNTAEAIKISLDTSKMILGGYLEDLSNEDFMVRPVPGANHIAWQMGHLIVSCNQMINGIKAGTAQDLPEGFADAYTKDTSKNDDASAFHTKDEYLKLFDQQYGAVYSLIETLNDEDWEKPSPEAMRSYAPTVGAAVSLTGTHVMMHAGQFAVVRRKLGKPVLF